MCKVIEDMRREEREEEREAMVLRLLALGKCTLEEIAAVSRLSLDTVKKLQADQAVPGV